MPKTYYAEPDVKVAIREAYAKGKGDGREEGRAEAQRFVKWASELNGSTPHVLKALEPTQPDLSTQFAKAMGLPEEAEPDPQEAATLALIDVLTEAKAHHPDGDGGEVASYLAHLLAHPDEL